MTRTTSYLVAEYFRLAAKAYSLPRGYRAGTEAKMRQVWSRMSESEKRMAREHYYTR